MGDSKEDPDAEVKFRIHDCVPYQVCPLCNGYGELQDAKYMTPVFEVCSVCGGSKVIPMAIVGRDLPVSKN